MRVRKLIRAPKAVTKAGAWGCGALNQNQKMGPKAFAFGSRKPFQLGNRWWWKVDHLDRDGIPARLLIAYKLEDECYLAWLAVERGSEHVIAACLEFHGNHPGWHYHTRCGALDDLQAGVRRQRNEGIAYPVIGAIIAKRRTTWVAGGHQSGL